jgi:bifunctional polynucleotide phosphatase/kinase
VAVGKQTIKPLSRDARSGEVDTPEDNTNANPEVRASWVELARAFKIPIRCVHFTASTRLCEHNDTVRALNPILVCGSHSLQVPRIS